MKSAEISDQSVTLSSSRDKLFYFTITTKREKLTFACKTMDERDEWIKM